ncbi:Protein of unknown function [Gryllus bimaculatus]|nr:Protein of unknown function [Gryllus bimaculatus]
MNEEQWKQFNVEAQRFWITNKEYHKHITERENMVSKLAELKREKREIEALGMNAIIQRQTPEGITHITSARAAKHDISRKMKRLRRDIKRTDILISILMKKLQTPHACVVQAFLWQQFNATQQLYNPWFSY